MDPFTVIALVGLIVSVIAGIDSTAGNAMAQNKTAKITRDAQAILSTLSRDAATIQKLLNAANQRDVHLARSLLYSSPIGNRVKKLEEEYSQNVDAIKRYNNQVVEKQEEINRAQNKVNKDLSEVPNTGSAIGNLISGSSKKPTTGQAGNIYLKQPAVKPDPNVL